MLEIFEEAIEEPGFWILCGGAIAMELIGWIISKRTMGYSFPLWQLLILIAGTTIASAYFATRG